MSFVYWLNKTIDKVRALGIGSSICDTFPGKTSDGTSILAVCVDEKIQVPALMYLGSQQQTTPTAQESPLTGRRDGSSQSCEDFLQQCVPAHGPSS